MMKCSFKYNTWKKFIINILIFQEKKYNLNWESNSELIVYYASLTMSAANLKWNINLYYNPYSLLVSTSGNIAWHPALQLTKATVLAESSFIFSQGFIHYAHVYIIHTLVLSFSCGLFYKGKVNSPRPSLHETWDKRPLGRDPDRS